jgi:uncharacterized membrane protein
MAEIVRGSYAFRARLKDELPRWRADGIIDAAIEERLVERYGLNENTTPVALLAVYVLGAFLIGGGVIAFVAWNWDDMSAALKVSVIVAAMLAAHLTGYWLWRVTDRSARLGHALMVLGTLIFGADIGLLAQIFHISSNWYGGFGAWALGAFVAAALMESAPTAALAIVLGFVWSTGFMEDHATIRPFIPYLIGAASLALTWVTRSRPVGTLALLGFGLCVTVAAGETADKTGAGVVLACVGVGALFLVVPMMFSGRGPLAIGPVATILGFVAFVVPTYVVSFHAVAREARLGELVHLVAAFPVFAAALLLAVRCFPGNGWLEHPVSTIALVSVPFIVAGCTARNTEFWLTAISNAALVAVAATAILVSVRGLARGPFWLGTFLGGLLIVSRFFEYESELWLKAIVFIACGVTVIFLGLAFERRLNEREAAYVA